MSNCSVCASDGPHMGLVPHWLMAANVSADAISLYLILQIDALEKQVVLTKKQRGVSARRWRKAEQELRDCGALVNTVLHLDAPFGGVQ